MRTKLTVQNRASSRWPALSHGRRPHGVPGLTGDGGRLRPLAAHVADHDRPAPVAGVEQVVEVPADLVPLAGRVVPGGHLEPRNLRQLAGEEARLQRPRHPGPLAVQAGVVGRQRGPAGQVDRQLHLRGPDRAVVGGGDQGRDTEDPPPGHQRKAE
jgi:hypothetical protein